MKKQSLKMRLLEDAMITGILMATNTAVFADAAVLQLFDTAE